MNRHADTDHPMPWPLTLVGHDPQVRGMSASAGPALPINVRRHAAAAAGTNKDPNACGGENIRARNLAPAIPQPHCGNSTPA